MSFKTIHDLMIIHAGSFIYYSFTMHTDAGEPKTTNSGVNIPSLQQNQGNKVHRMQANGQNERVVQLSFDARSL